jgi:hypothetical protein
MNSTVRSEIIERLKSYRALREADEEPDDEEEAEKMNDVELDNANQAVQPEVVDEPSEDPDTQPLTDERNEPIADGQIPATAEGITTGAFDPLNPQGYADLSFKSGNINALNSEVEALQQKASLVQQTFIPLVEKAMIELLGSNNLYRREVGNTQVSYDNGQPAISGTLVYSVALWIGLEVEHADIQHDSEYVLNTIKVCEGVKVTKCQIDTKEGTLTISFYC